MIMVAGLRKVALVALASSAAAGLSACSAGQITQTASQVAAVDGGNATVGPIHVQDVRIVHDAETRKTQLGFVASYSGLELDNTGTKLTSLTVAGQDVDVSSLSQELGRDCSLVAEVEEGYEGALSAVAGKDGGPCIEAGIADLGTSRVFDYGKSTPVEFEFEGVGKVEALASIHAPSVKVPEVSRAEKADHADHHDGHKDGHKDDHHGH